MKKIIKLCILFLGILIVITAAVSLTVLLKEEKPSVPEEESVFDRTPLDKASVFGDYVFEEKIRTLLKLDKGEKIDEKKLSALTELDLSSNASGISTDKMVLSLEGLKYFPSLNRLVLDKNRVESLEPLKNCPSLVSLSAKDCDLSDEKVSVLSDFQGLIYLNLRGNGIRTLDFLKSLRNLQYLDLGQNDFSELSVFEEASFEALEELYIDTTDVEDLSVLCENLKTLTLLDISGLQIYDKDVEPLKKLQRLKVLYADANNLKTPAVFSELPNLEKLSLAENRINSFKPFEACKNLKELNLSFNLLNDLEGIEKLDKLTRFNGKNNRIASYAPLDEAKALEYVSVDNETYCKGE